MHIFTHITSLYILRTAFYMFDLFVYRIQVHRPLKTLYVRTRVSVCLGVCSRHAAMKSRVLPKARFSDNQILLKID